MCKVSVIIPYYNREETIIRSIKSVAAQTYKNFEIILVDDGSNDKGPEKVNEFIEENKNLTIIHLREKNGGPSKARNQGILASKGEYVAFLDSDDSWEKNKLEIQIGVMEKDKEIMITGTNYKIKTENEEIIKYKLIPKYQEGYFYKMLFKMFFCMPTVVIRREVFIKDNLFFKEGKNQAEDHLLFLQIIRKYKGIRINIPLTNIYKFEFGEDGLSKDLEKLKIHEYDNFRILYSDNKSNSKKINKVLFCLVIVFAYIKHLKRVLTSKVYRKLSFSFQNK